MHDTSNRRQSFESGGDELVNFVLVCHIAPPNDNLCTKAGKIVHQFLDLSSHGTASGHEDNMSSSLSNHPSGHAPSEAAGAANQHICSIRTE